MSIWRKISNLTQWRRLFLIITVNRVGVILVHSRKLSQSCWGSIMNLRFVVGKQ